MPEKIAVGTGFVEKAVGFAGSFSQRPVSYTHLTQQLARNVFLTHKVSWQRKIQEIFISFQLERIYSKDDILEFYINNIYFSDGYYGIQAASRGYFDQDVSELNLSQIAFLCAIPNNPTPVSYTHLIRILFGTGTCRQFPNLTFAPRKTCHIWAATSRFNAINVTARLSI